jgi:hypothetical protein
MARESRLPEITVQVVRWLSPRFCGRCAISTVREKCAEQLSRDWSSMWGSCLVDAATFIFELDANDMIAEGESLIRSDTELVFRLV